MLTLLKLANGKNVYLDGDSVEQKEALEIAHSLVKTWGKFRHAVKESSYG